MAEILQTVSVFIAALAVVVGITAWRRTELGKRRIELAEETLALFYEARDAIHMIRSPFGIEGEGTTRERREGEAVDVAEARDRAFVAIERYNGKVELFAKLAALQYRFRAYFGDAACEPFGELNAVLQEIFAASHILSELWVAERYHGADGLDEQGANEALHARKIFWEGTAQPDLLNPRIDNLIAQIEWTCQEVISPRPTICTLCRRWIADARRFWLCR